jgi:large subunit ribosomal protein L31
MKKDTHPNYRKVLFVDSTTNHKYLIGSTLQVEETEEFEGKEYPVCKVPTSSVSHPFFTGSRQFVDQEGRIDKFRRRYAEAQKQQPKEEKKPLTKKKK